jgi:hypothetical protein
MFVVDCPWFIMKISAKFSGFWIHDGEYRPRHSAWKESCDSLAVMGLHENWT